MNHLEKAKENTPFSEDKIVGILHALIAIAEQLEKIAEGKVVHRVDSSFTIHGDYREDK